MKSKHIGFKGAQKKVESEGYSKKSAGAIIASASRNASPSAKAKNPKLKKVAMPKEGSKKEESMDKTEKKLGAMLSPKGQFKK